MKIVVVSLIIISLAVWALWSANEVTLVKPVSEPIAPSVTTDTDKTPSSSAAPKPPAPKANDAIDPVVQDNKPHVDHLSPQMKQAVKDKLFHHGPKTTTKDSQGRIRLDHAGRFVNMPVAVRKADGSIEIKEYSVVPKTHTEVTK